jgi:hypothetical protein
MIQIALFIGIAVLLLGLLFSLGAGRESGEASSEEILEESRSRRAGEPDATACARRIFSPQDWEFVDGLKEPHLQRLYRTERARVAEEWVRETSEEVRKIMRRHRLAARQSQNLEVRGEVKLLVHYVELRLVCGVLICMIRTFGPHSAREVAAFGGQLLQGMGAGLQARVAEGSAT